MQHIALLTVGTCPAGSISRSCGAARRLQYYHRHSHILAAFCRLFVVSPPLRASLHSLPSHYENPPMRHSKFRHQPPLKGEGYVKDTRSTGEGYANVDRPSSDFKEGVCGEDLELCDILAQRMWSLRARERSKKERAGTKRRRRHFISSSLQTRRSMDQIE